MNKANCSSKEMEAESLPETSAPIPPLSRKLILRIDYLYELKTKKDETHCLLSRYIPSVE